MKSSGKPKELLHTNPRLNLRNKRSNQASRGGRKAGKV
jgi:hypothetical protein